MGSSLDCVAREDVDLTVGSEHTGEGHRDANVYD